MNPVILQNGFRKTGSYAVNREAIPKNTFNNVQLHKWEQYIQMQKAQKNLTTGDRFEINAIENNEDLYENIIPSLKTLVLETVNKEMMGTESPKGNNGNKNKKEKFEKEYASKSTKRK